jgi:hypothetical protein
VRAYAPGVRIHHVGETPQVYYLHWWARGNPVDLARRIRPAIDTLPVGRSTT